MSVIQNFSDTYEILDKLGEGAGGIVYKAYHKRLRQEVVIKQHRRSAVSLTGSRREVDILKNLHHSYLPQVLDFFEIDGDVYTVMSYVPGKSFAQLLAEGYRFTPKELIRWGMQICSALNYLHSQNPPVIHCDIKPANIMLTPEGEQAAVEARQERERMADELFGILTGEEKEQLYPLLEKLADAWAADEAKQGEGIK